MNRRRYRLGGFVVAVAVTLLPDAFASTASADPIDDQRALVSQITDTLEELERRSDILAEDHVTAIDEKNQLDAQVAAAEQRVAEQQVAVDALRSQLSQVAVQAYMGAGTNGFGPVFNSSTDVTDGLARDQLSRVAMSAGTATTDELDQALADLEQEQDALADARQQAEAKAEQVAAAREATDRQRAEYMTARQEAEAELGSLIAEEEERRARESYLRMQKEAEEAAARQQAEAQAAAAAAQQAQARSASAAPSTRDGGDDGGGGGGGVAAAAAVPEAATQAIPPASSRAGTAVNAALAQQGVPYRFAASEPGVAFDCSGLTAYAWAQAGVSLPHQSRAQFASVTRIPTEAAQPGDLLFFYSPISHVSIYLGGGRHVHAPNTGTVVNVSSVNWGNVVGVGRPG